MKDIIANLETKRAVVCAGGACCLALVILFAAMTTSAHAQAVWRSPSNSFTLVIPNGWMELQTQRHWDDVLLTVGRNDFQEFCEVNRVVYPELADGRSQAQLNETMARWTVDDIAYISRPNLAPGRVVSHSNGLNADVQVLGIEIVTPENARVASEHFVLEGDTGLYSIRCGLAHEAESVENIHAMLSSLTFLPRGVHP